MSRVTIGIDLGTTTLTALALGAEDGRVLASETVGNDADATSAPDRALGRAESDPERIVAIALGCLRAVAERLGDRAREVAGIGLAGQQHGVLLVDDAVRPLTPFISWRDGRGDDRIPGGTRSYAEEAVRLMGEEACARAGCRPATGYMGITLHWLKAHGRLPRKATACFIADFLGARLAARAPATDPTLAATSGLFDVRARKWDSESIDALQLPPALLPEVREATRPLGALAAGPGGRAGLAPGIPVYGPVGDSQAAFLGGTRGRDGEAFVNIGTGAQVAARSGRFLLAPPLETRPLPGEGYLLAGAQPGGGAAYAALEEFFRMVLGQFAGRGGDPLYERMNALAASAPPGAGGLLCRPLFWGTRAAPEARAAWTGMSGRNFTPAHLARALLEGIVELLKEDLDRIVQATGTPLRCGVGCGNGLRKNPLLRTILSDKLGFPIDVPPCPEEAAVGAARLAADGLTGGCR